MRKPFVFRIVVICTKHVTQTKTSVFELGGKPFVFRIVVICTKHVTQTKYRLVEPAPK